MRPITYVSDQQADYTNALARCSWLADLLALVRDYGDLTGDARAVVEQMTGADYQEFSRGLLKERRGKYAGDQWADKYAAILMPEVMFRVSLVAQQFKVPWGCAYIRLKETDMLPKGSK